MQAARIPAPHQGRGGPAANGRMHAPDVTSGALLFSAVGVRARRAAEKIQICFQGFARKIGGRSKGFGMNGRAVALLCRKPGGFSLGQKGNQMTQGTGNKVDLSRRRIMIRAGLVAGAAYVAPVLAGLDAARASGNSGGGSGGGSRGGNSGASRGGNSGPSRGGNSGPSRASGPSRSGPSGRGRRSSRRNDDMPGWVRQVFGG